MKIKFKRQDQKKKIRQRGSAIITVNKVQTTRIEHDEKMETDASNIVSIKSSLGKAPLPRCNELW